MSGAKTSKSKAFTKCLETLVFSLLLTVILGCASAPDMSIGILGKNPERSSKRESKISGQSSIKNRKAAEVVEGALFLVGKEELIVNGKTFPNDCTGVVRAAYWYAGIDLAKDFSKYAGNGVARIYKTMEAENLIYNTDIPQPGDIVFWDDTYDRNEDGKWNDPLTHIGVIVSAHPDGSIEYVHANYRKGVVPEHMNLKDPDTNTKKARGETVVVNSAMRMKGQVTNALWLSSHLYRSFGKGYFYD
jgi:hypothetical protein